MKRNEFIEWLETRSGFSKEWSAENNDTWWKELVDYGEYIYDELSVETDNVTFMWEEFYWGGRETKSRELSFEEFIERYNNYELKY